MCLQHRSCLKVTQVQGGIIVAIVAWIKYIVAVVVTVLVHFSGNSNMEACMNIHCISLFKAVPPTAVDYDSHTVFLCPLQIIHKTFVKDFLACKFTIYNILMNVGQPACQNVQSVIKCLIGNFQMYEYFPLLPYLNITCVYTTKTLVSPVYFLTVL